MYSFRDPKSLISKTDKSESPHTSINYKSKDLDMVESSTETGTVNASFVTKKKLKMPTTLSGKRERTFKIFSKKSRFISWKIVESTLLIWIKFSLSSLM